MKCVVLCRVVPYYICKEDLNIYVCICIYIYIYMSMYVCNKVITWKNNVLMCFYREEEHKNWAEKLK